MQLFNVGTLERHNRTAGVKNWQLLQEQFTHVSKARAPLNERKFRLTDLPLELFSPCSYVALQPSAASSFQ